MNPDKLQQLDRILSVIGENVTAKEVMEIFQVFIEVIKVMKTDVERRISESDGTQNEANRVILQNLADYEKRVNALMGEHRKSVSGEVRGVLQTVMREIENVKKLIPGATDLTVLERRIEEIGKRPPIVESAAEIRNKLESLIGDERLDKSAIKGLEELWDRPGKHGAQAPGDLFFGGPRGLNLSVDGIAKGVVQYLNLIAGTGITLTTTVVGGRTNITINSTGGGGSSAAVTVLNTEGAIDDSNTIFPFDSKPKLLCINGMLYPQSGGAITWTWDGTNAVTSSPVGSGPSNSIFGLTGTFMVTGLTGSGDPDVNTSFNGSIEPDLIVVGGASYQKIGGAMTWDYSNGVATLSQPVGSSQIFGIAGLSSVITVNGARNDINQTFTGNAEPTLLNVNGGFYLSEGGGVTWVYASGTFALSSPVGTGGTLFGII